MPFILGKKDVMRFIQDGDLYRGGTDVDSKPKTLIHVSGDIPYLLCNWEYSRLLGRYAPDACIKTLHYTKLLRDKEAKITAPYFQILHLYGRKGINHALSIAQTKKDYNRQNANSHV